MTVPISSAAAARCLTSTDVELAGLRTLTRDGRRAASWRTSAQRLVVAEVPPARMIDVRTSMADVFTVPNAISAVGLSLVLKGSARADTSWGITLTVAGRLLDLLDGKVARLLDQSSPFGAGIDAAFDKAGVLAIGINEWRYRIAPRPALLAIAAQNAVNLAATAISTRLGDDQLVPVHDGKRAMGFQNGALGAYAVAGLLRKRDVPVGAKVFQLIGHADALIGVGYYGIRASTQYVSRVRHLLSQPR